MLDRWRNEIQGLPELDQQDAEAWVEGKCSQLAPEFSQEIYERLLIQENEQFLGDYLGTKDQNSSAKYYKLRDDALCSTIKLCQKKGYT